MVTDRPPYRTNIVIILGMMQLAKKVPFDDPNVLNACRGLYVVSNLIILGIYLYLKTAIDKKKGTCSLENTATKQIHMLTRGPAEQT